MMTGATTPTNTASYTYSPDGLRTSKTVGATSTVFAWDDTAPVPQVIQDGNNYYVYGPDGLPVERLGADPTQWLMCDATGSVIGSTDATGNITSSQSYDPWGNATIHTGSPVSLGWQGQYQDPETGYYYLQHRYYDPTTAQFTTPDPLYPLTGSRYGYAANDPVNGTDPTGLWCPLGKNPNGSCRGSGVIPNCVAIHNENCKSIKSTDKGVTNFLYGTAGLALTVASGGTALSLGVGAGTASVGEAVAGGILGGVLSADSNASCQDHDRVACVSFWTGLGSIGSGFGALAGGGLGVGFAWGGLWTGIASWELWLFDACGENQ